MNEMYIVVFKIGNKTYGIDISHAREIIPLKEVYKVPNVENFILGVANLRGEIVPVISMKVLLGLEKEKDRELSFIVSEVGGDVVGIAVDKVLRVMRVSGEQFKPAVVIEDWFDGGQFIKGVVEVGENDLIVVFDVVSIINYIVKTVSGRTRKMIGGTL